MDSRNWLLPNISHFYTSRIEKPPPKDSLFLMVSTLTRMTQHSTADTFPDKPFQLPSPFLEGLLSPISGSYG